MRDFETVAPNPLKTLTLFQAVQSQIPVPRETFRVWSIEDATQVEGPVVALGREYSTLAVELAEANQTTGIRFCEAGHTRNSSLFVRPRVFENGRLPSTSPEQVVLNSACMCRVFEFGPLEHRYEDTSSRVVAKSAAPGVHSQRRRGDASAFCVGSPFGARGLHRSAGMPQEPRPRRRSTGPLGSPILPNPPASLGLSAAPTRGYASLRCQVISVSIWHGWLSSPSLPCISLWNPSSRPVKPPI